MQVNQKEIKSATFTGTKMMVVVTHSAVTSAHYAFIYSVKRGMLIGTSQHDTQDEAFEFARHITTAIQ